MAIDHKLEWARIARYPFSAETFSDERFGGLYIPQLGELLPSRKSLFYLAPKIQQVSEDTLIVFRADVLYVGSNRLRTAAAVNKFYSFDEVRWVQSGDAELLSTRRR